MISFKMDKQLQTISNYFLFSLAVADFIIGEQTPHIPSFSPIQVWNFSVWLEKKCPPFFNGVPSSLGMLLIAGIPVAGRQFGDERSSHNTSLTPWHPN